MYIYFYTVLFYWISDLELHAQATAFTAGNWRFVRCTAKKIKTPTTMACKIKPQIPAPGLHLIVYNQFE